MISCRGMGGLCLFWREISRDSLLTRIILGVRVRFPQLLVALSLQLATLLAQTDAGLHADPHAALYTERAVAIPVGFGPGHAALAHWCVREGLHRQALDQIGLALPLAAEHPALRAAIDELAFAVAPDWLARARKDDRVEVLVLQRAASGFGAAAVAAKLAADEPAAERLRVALKALDGRSASARWCAAKLLAELRKEPLRIKPLYRAGLLDAEAQVRRAAVQALALTEDPVFVGLYSKHLVNEHAAIRVRAAEALEVLNQRAGAEGVLRALEASYQPARANLTVTHQTAYLKDFDVQVAQGAVIADPVVAVVQSGVVLDVAVVSVTAERTVYRRVLARLLHRDCGEDLAAWRAALVHE